MMVLLEKHTGLAVNTDEIRSFQLDRSGPVTCLVITMRDRFELRVKNIPGPDGVNVHELHQWLLEAK